MELNNETKIDLRVNNWVATKPSSKHNYSTYTTLQNSSFSVPFDKNYERIKLSKDWLKRLQFEWRPCSWVGELYLCKTINNLKVFIQKDGKFRIEYYKQADGFVNAEMCEFVDELQNITFDLTGSELEYKR